MRSTSLSKNTIEDYKKYLRKRKVIGISYSHRSENYEISKVKAPKIALNTFDDKRCFFNKDMKMYHGVF